MENLFEGKNKISLRNYKKRKIEVQESRIKNEKKGENIGEDNSNSITKIAI